MTAGEMLGRARKSAGVTVADLAQMTKIRASIIAAIERDDFDHCGGFVYARGQVRSMAVVLGVDPDPIIAQFEQQALMQPAEE
ncbi:unannotated protein [freshwater metagenome]|uniref:Unannotated protein n=1 Tax=freshwater metagenome TaxID=449393 RepID=A0A6J7ET88_9ZZZZ